MGAGAPWVLRTLRSIILVLLDQGRGILILLFSYCKTDAWLLLWRKLIHHDSLTPGLSNAPSAEVVPYTPSPVMHPGEPSTPSAHQALPMGSFGSLHTPISHADAWLAEA